MRNWLPLQEASREGMSLFLSTFCPCSCSLCHRTHKEQTNCPRPHPPSTSNLDSQRWRTRIRPSTMASFIAGHALSTTRCTCAHCRVYTLNNSVPESIHCSLVRRWLCALNDPPHPRMSLDLMSAHLGPSAMAVALDGQPCPPAFAVGIMHNCMGLSIYCNT